MLDAMRRNAQSWLVKLLFAAIVIVFVFWGIGSFTEDRQETVAVINDQPILVQEFSRAYENAAQRMRQQNPEISREDLRQMQFRQQVFSQMLNSRLLLQQAQELGLSVTQQELQEEITSIPAFFDETGSFDPGRYERMLSAQRMTPSQFERDFKQSLLMDKMEKYIALPARPNEQQVREYFHYVRSQAQIEYVLLEPEKYYDQVTLEEEQIAEYYENNQEQFQEPEKIQIAYLELTPRALAPKQSVSQEEIEDYYERHSHEFAQPEQVSARHILVQVDENAPETEQEAARNRIQQIATELEQGADFAELAQEHSECPTREDGGDLGTFSRGDMYPEFEDAAFELSPGEISQPVRSSAGWHLIKVQDYVEAETRDLEEVQEEIRLKVGKDKARDRIGDYADDVLENIVAGNSLEEAADQLGLEVAKTDYFSQAQGPEELDLPEQDVSRLFDLLEGEATETPIMLDDGYLYAQKTGQQDPKIPPMEEVQQEIQDELVRSEAARIAREQGEAKLKSIQQGEKDPANLEMKLSEPFGRDGSIPDLGRNQELGHKVFETEPGHWLPEVYGTEAGYILARTYEHIEPREEEFEQQKDRWMQSYADMQRQQMFGSFVTMMRNRADIQMVRPEILEE